MSDSDDLSTPANIPSDAKIEDYLRQIVRRAVAEEAEITVNLARSQAEEELGLDEGFFKYNDVWKKRSKDVISEAVEQAESPEKPVSKSVAKPAAKAGAKRKFDEAQTSRKKTKPSPAEESDSIVVSAENSSERVKPRGTRPSVITNALSDNEEESALSEPPEDVSEPPTAASNGKAIDGDDDSDLSSVIDVPPKKKRQKKSTSPSTQKPKTTKPGKAAKPQKSSKLSKPEKEQELAPGEEEIKRLQSWLLKCGIRKLWHRELAPFPTTKEKIGHLKKLLDDVGMSGRFSADKAKQIKEARELNAELEAAKEFNEHWGHGAGDGSDGSDVGKDKQNAQPTRRLKPKGLVDFGDSDSVSG